MFDLGRWGEGLILLVAALILIKPKEWPGLLQSVGRGLFHLRRWSHDMTSSLRTWVDDGHYKAYKTEKNKQIMKETTVSQQILEQGDSNANNTPPKSLSGDVDKDPRETSFQDNASKKP